MGINMYLKRKIYNKLIDWKNSSSLTLELKGGKTGWENIYCKKIRKGKFP